MKGVRNPIGSKIFSVSLRIERFVGGSELPNLYSSLRSKKNSSETVSQFSPRILTIVSFFASELPGVVEDLAYDSSSSVVGSWFDLLSPRGFSQLSIALFKIGNAN